MKKRIVSMLLALIMVTALIPFSAFSVFGEEESEWGDHTEISTLAELEAFAAKVNGGESFSGKTVVLTADIGDENAPFTTPIGIYSQDTPFSGTFDGNGHTVYLGMSGEGRIGLFGYMINAAVKNVTVVGTVTSTDSYAAGIAVHAEGGSIEGCVNLAGITGSTGAGGILYTAKNTVVSGCINRGDVAASSSAGGVAENCVFGTVLSNCLNTGTVSGRTAGGIAALLAQSEIVNCASLGEITTTMPASACFPQGGVGVTVDNFFAGGTLSGSSISLVTDSPVFSSATHIYTTIENSKLKAECNRLGIELVSDLDAAAAALNTEAEKHEDWYRWIVSDGELMLSKPITGAGTREDPYRIENVYQLEYFAYTVNAGNSYSGKYISLTADIGDENTPFTTPIGDYSEDIPFSGTFDGNGHTVYLGMSGEGYIGLFGYMKDAAVKNVTAAGTVANTGSYAAGIAVSAKDSRIENCVNLAGITGSSGAGGILYTANNTVISGCINRGDVAASLNAGGIACDCSFGCVFTNCLNTGTVSGKNVGGIVALLAQSEIVNCASLGKITATGIASGCISQIAMGVTVDNFFAGGSLSGLTIYVVNAQIQSSSAAHIYTTIEGIRLKSEYSRLGIELVSDLDAAAAALNTEVANHEDWYRWFVLNGELMLSKPFPGAGTQAAPYLIENVDQLEYFAYTVNAGNDYSGKYISLTADIGDENTPFTTPIGTGALFSGTFDGNGHTVYLEMSGEGYIGLFGKIKNAAVKNVTAAGTATSTDSYAAGIVVHAEGGSIEGCVNLAGITGNSGAGGILYNARGTVINACINRGNVTANGGAGGIIHTCSPSVILSNCLNTGAVSGKNAGGVAMQIDATDIFNCATVGEITGTNTANGCFYTGEMGVTVDNFFVGGTLSGAGINAVNNHIQSSSATHIYTTIENSKLNAEYSRLGIELVSDLDAAAAALNAEVANHEDWYAWTVEKGTLAPVIPEIEEPVPPLVLSAEGAGSVTVAFDGTLAENITSRTGFEPTSGATLSLSAVGENFLFWKNNKNGAIFSTDAVLTLPAIRDFDLTAVFSEAEEEELCTVYFKDLLSGRIVQTLELAPGTELTEEMFPTVTFYGYTLTGWELGEADAAGYVIGEEDTTLILVTAYERDTATNVVITVKNAGKVVTVTRPYAASIAVKAKGENFSYWTLDGEVISLDRNLRFCAPGADCVLEAVYEAEDAPEALAATVDLSLRNDTIYFTFSRSVPADAALLETGVLLTRKATAEDLTVDTAENTVTRGYSTAPNADNIVGFVKDVTGKLGTWLVRGYVTYQLAGETKTVYTAIGSIVVE